MKVPMTKRMRFGKAAWVAAAAGLVIAGVAVYPLANAVHDDGLFELGNGSDPTVSGSGDILGSTAQPGPDWGDLYDANGNVVQANVSAFGGTTAVFLRDQLAVASGADNTAYSSTSDKNNDPIPTWTWGTENVPAKDDLANAYAYATVDPRTNHTMVYVGFERIVANGDSHIDIELFQDNVHLDHAVPCPGATLCHFVGNRTDRDVLIAVDFSNGGDLGTVSVRIFNADTGTYDEVENLSAEGCNGLAAGNLTPDSICAFDNGGSIDGGPWPNYDHHGHVVTTLPKNAFTEFGFDLTNAAGGSTPCISTILGKTRSSQSFTAELKDFAGPFPFDLCGGNIQIRPDATNEVGQPHTFHVSANKSISGTVSPVPDGSIVTVQLNASNGANVTLLSDTCASGTVSGQCDVTFTSPTTGVVTGHACVTFTSSGITQTFCTDGTGGSSGDATKRFVDASITIAPTLATNNVNASHTFTVTVRQDAGDGAGFVAASVGHVTVQLTPSGGATPVVNTTASTCDDAGDNLDSSGQCALVFTSATAGTVVGHASVALTISGLAITRETDGVAPNSGDATKIFVEGTLEWRKVDNAGNALGGATFQVCRTSTFNATSGQEEDTPDVCVSVLDDAAPDVNASAGGFRLANLTLGVYTVRETIPPPGFAPDPATRTVEINASQQRGVVAQAFVDLRPSLKVTAFGYVNVANGTPTAGVVTGNTTFTITLHNYGGAVAIANTTLVVTGAVAYVGETGSGNVTHPAGSAGCGSGCTISWNGVAIAPGADVTFTVTVRYNNAPDGSVIAAALSSLYTTGLDGFTRTASGSPASESFTVQAD